MKSQTTEGGFLLFETLLAVLILTVGLTLVISSFGSSLDALRVSGDYTKAMLLLEEKMGDLEAKDSIVPGIFSGVFSQDSRKFQWEVSASTLNPLELCEVQVTVFWEQKGRSRDISVVTYLKEEVEV